MSQLPYKKPYTDLIRYPPIHHQAEDKSPIIYEAIEVWTEEEILRNNDLLYFIQDFVNSPEYHNYIQRKVEKHFEDKSTQCNTLKGGSDLNDLEITILSEKANKVWRFTKQLKKFEEDEHNRRHDTAVKIIRQKIKEVRVLYLKRLAHGPEDEERKLKWLDEYAKENDIDLTHLKIQNKIRIVHRTVKLWKEEKLKKCRQQENLMKIVQKLLNEYQRDKEIDAMKNKSYDYKVRRKEKILKGMEVVGTKIVLKPRFPEVITEEVEEEEMLEEEVKVKKEKGKKGKKDKRDKMKGKKDKKKDKKGKGSKSIKTSKKTKKGKEDEFKLPLIPIVNPRERIQLKNFSQLKELVGLFEKFEDILEEERYRKGLLREVYPKDFDFALVPEMIKFSGGVEGKTYKKMMKIINKSSKVKRCRILRVTFEDDFDRALFKFEAIGIQRLISGGCFTLTVHYYPPDDNKTVEGTIYFLTWDDNVPNYAQFTIPIKVLPKHSHLQISPINIDFGKIPFWKTKKNPLKTIKLNNKGQKECTIVIKKIANPWDSSPIEEEPTAMIQSLIMECVDYKFHNFQFQDYYLKIQPNQDLKIPITFQNYTHLGFYMEKYLLEIYEDQIWTGSQELTTQIEIKNHFIFAEPPILDFGVCVFNSLYQLNIEIRNTSTTTRTLTLKFPSSLQNCLTSDSPNIFVAPQQRRVVWIKFLPRETIKKYCQYFDGQTGILEFPIHVHVISKNYSEIPDVKVAVFAILTEMNDLSLVPSDVGITECVDNERLIMHMGVVTTDETGVAYVNLTNNTEVCQVYGFLDLPEYVTVSPDHGFGQILPHEVKILKVELAVEPGDFHDRTIEKIFDFKLTVDTLYNRGRTKPTINNRRLKRSMEMVLQELKIDKNRDLHLEMLSSLSHLHQILAEDSNTSVEDVSQDIEQYLQHLQGQEAEENIEETIKYCIERVKSNVLHVLATIRQPRYRFDYQFVEFPDTACGSYSLAFINLRGVYPKFSGKFVIGRDNPEMEVEPCCGRVENGGVVRLSLVSRPQVPEDLVLERAKLLKTRDVYLRKLEEMERARLEALQKELTGGKKKKKQKKKGKKEKKPSKKSSKSSKKSKETEVKKEYCPPLIKVEDKEVVIEDLDLLPAEMFQWMSMNPYRIDGHFTCTLTYDDGQKEVLYFDATCRVIIPNFITNLTSQKIDFGAVTIGNRATKDVVIQNITEKPIRVQIEEVSPLEKLSIVKEPKIRIPPGLMLKVPISFAPEGNEKFQEFLEIRSGPTIFPICLTGEGVEPNFTVTPAFNVYRIETKEKDINELTFEVVNKSIANIILSLEKVLEIEGLIKEIPKPKEAKKSGKKDKGSKKSEKKDKGSKKGQKKTEGNSNELTEDEVESIKQYFRKFEGDSNFDFILGEPDQDRLVVNGQSKKTFKIRFGKPSLLWQSRQPKLEKEKKKSGKTKSKSTKSSKTKSKSSKSSKASQKKKGKQYTYYIVKYNLLLGVNFVRDFIVIACFL